MHIEPALEVPWLAPQIERLQRARAGGRYPGALLIHDARGAGGLWLGQRAAQMALCRALPAPCGACRDCRLFLARQHPDFLAVAPIEDSKQIRIEQIRELTDELTLTAHAGGAVAALIAPADALNANAANALLKTLEEPRAAVTLILVANVPSRLPATVLSRCQRLRVAAPTRAAALSWLERQRGSGPWGAVLDVIGNAPFEALELDPQVVARLAAETFEALTGIATGRLEIPGFPERWARTETFELRLACIETWLTACIDRAAGGRDQSRELRTGAHLPEPAWDMNIAGLLRLLESAYELRRLRLTAINRSIALEQLLWQLPRTVRAAAAC
ncbi:MAG TPA: hypothetical protein VIX87_09735 [Steroidobacteraceae bacterium]